MPATLNEKVVLALEPRASGPYEVRDRGGKQSIPGLLLRIQPSGKKTYYVEIARAKRERIGDASVHTLKWAREKAKSMLGKAAEGHDFQAERRRKRVLKDTTLRSYLDGPYKTYAEAAISNWDGMLSRVTRVFEHVLDKPMTEITELDLAQWRKQRQGKALATQRRELADLKAVLNHAIGTKAIPGHQLSHYRVRGGVSDRDSSPKIRYLTDDEERRLRDAMDSREAKLRHERASANRWREERGYVQKPDISCLAYADYLKPLVLLALNTGLRRGDLFGLTWEHIDLNQRQIRKVIEKTSHARRKAGKTPSVSVLPLSPEAHVLLSRWKEQCNDNSPYVFASPRTGGRLDNINNAWESLLSGAKIADFRFHDLRHTFASRLVMAGVDINTVRELMTHSDIKMTLVYAHLSPDHKAAALEKAFGSQS